MRRDVWRAGRSGRPRWCALRTWCVVERVRLRSALPPVRPTVATPGPPRRRRHPATCPVDCLLGCPDDPEPGCPHDCRLGALQGGPLGAPATRRPGDPQIGPLGALNCRQPAAMRSAGGQLLELPSGCPAPLLLAGPRRPSRCAAPAPHPDRPPTARSACPEAETMARDSAVPTPTLLPCVARQSPEHHAPGVRPSVLRTAPARRGSCPRPVGQTSAARRCGSPTRPRDASRLRRPVEGSAPSSRRVGDSANPVRSPTGSAARADSIGPATSGWCPHRHASTTDRTQIARWGAGRSTSNWIPVRSRRPERCPATDGRDGVGTTRSDRGGTQAADLGRMSTGHLLRELLERDRPGDGPG